jgi:hypothetical protein
MGHQRDIERERAFAERLAKLAVGAGTTLVARHVVATRVPIGVVAQRLEVGGARLFEVAQPRALGRRRGGSRFSRQGIGDALSSFS